MLCIGLSWTHAAQADDVYDSATWLMQRAALPQRDGSHNILLRSLRQMRDPELAPFFEKLVSSNHPGLKIHGVLGLSELSRPPALDLARVAEIQDGSVQTQLISSAIEGQLLQIDQAKQLYAWPKIDPSVRVLVATELQKHGALKDVAPLEPALHDANPGVQGLAALLMMQHGRSEAAAHLENIDQSKLMHRDNIRGMLLQTAIEHQLTQAGPWALRMLREPDLQRDMHLLCHRASLVLKAPGAEQAWSRAYADTHDAPADRILLSMVALGAAQHVAPTLFDPMIAEDDPVLNRSGRAGRLMASGESPRTEFFQLLQTNHLLVGKWAVRYTRDLPVETARPLRLAIVLVAEHEPNPELQREQRLANAVFAVEKLVEEDTEATKLIRNLMSRLPTLSQEAVLMGLIRANAPQSGAMIEGMDSWQSTAAKSMALLLRAKHGVALTPDQLHALELIVRGGGGLQPPLRVQAAWTVLKLRKQQNNALRDIQPQT